MLWIMDYMYVCKMDSRSFILIKNKMENVFFFLASFTDVVLKYMLTLYLQIL